MVQCNTKIFSSNGFHCFGQVLTPWGLRPISQHAKKHLGKVNDTNTVTTANMEFERTTQRIIANPLAGTQKHGNANGL